MESNIRRCLACDHILTDVNMGQCPECGRRFDPTIPGSVNTGRPLGSVGRRLLRPPGLLTWAAIASLWLVALWDARMGFPPVVPVIYAAGFLVATAGMLLCRYFIAAGTATVLRQPTVPWSLRHRRVIVPWLLAGVLAFLLLHWRVPLAIYFIAAKPNLERACQIAGQPSRTGGGTGTVAGIRSCAVVPEGVVIEMDIPDGHGFRRGFLKALEPKVPADTSLRSYEPVPFALGWYVWFDSGT